jgi:putative SOS response-associated peptidase YedK
MCTRYSLERPEAAIARVAVALAAKLAPLPEGAMRPRYNVALTSRAPVVVAGASGPELREMVWGLVSVAGREQLLRRMLPNARAETAAQLSAFRQGMAQRRCLVPACGFYEWCTTGKVKWPHLFTRRDGEPFALAGIWEPGSHAEPDTFCVLTTAPNALVARVHGRMPVILTPEAMSRWLAREPLSAVALAELTRPFLAEAMTERAVSRFVSNPRHEGPECHAPVESAGVEGQNVFWKELGVSPHELDKGIAERAGGERPCGLGL